MPRATCTTLAHTPTAYTGGSCRVVSSGLHCINFSLNPTIPIGPRLSFINPTPPPTDYPYLRTSKGAASGTFQRRSPLEPTSAFPWPPLPPDDDAPAPDDEEAAAASSLEPGRSATTAMRPRAWAGRV